MKFCRKKLPYSVRPFSPLIFSLDYVFFWYFLFCYSKLFLFCHFFAPLSYVFCWYFLLCYADPATDLCHSWNFLPASRLLPQLLTAFFSGNLGKYGTQQKIYNALGIVIFLTIFPRSFPIASLLYRFVFAFFHYSVFASIVKRGHYVFFQKFCLKKVLLMDSLMRS